VIKAWEELPPTKAKAKQEGAKEWRNGRTAKRYAKMVAAKYANGGYFKSMGEVYMAEELRKLKAKNKIKGYKYEPEIFHYQYEVQNYTPDFKVILQNDDVLFLEYKGKMTREVRKKMRAIKRCNPDVDIYMVFERANNKIERNSKTTYKQWAEKQGFKCSNKTIHEEWLN
jgi:hypothetical protein